MIAAADLLEMIDAAGKTYDPAAVASWEIFGPAVRGFVTKRPDGFTHIATEGTKNAPGWAVDFLALGAEWHYGVQHDDIGWVHAGFFAAAVATFPKVLPIAQAGDYDLEGHSLGAAETLALAALLIRAARLGKCKPPARIACFAPPLVGDAQFVEIVTSVPFVAFRYGQDPVPDVPVPIPPLFPYKQIPLIELPAPGPAVDPLDIIGRVAFHHWPNYDAACRVWVEDQTKG